MYNYFQSTSFCRVCCWRALPMLPIGRSCFYWPSLSCLTNYEHVLYLVFGIWYLNNDLCRSYCSLDFWCVELSVRGSVDKIDWRGRGEEEVEGEWRHTKIDLRFAADILAVFLSPPHTLTHTHSADGVFFLLSLSLLLAWRRRKLPLKSKRSTLFFSFILPGSRHDNNNNNLYRLSCTITWVVSEAEWTTWTSWQCCQSALN